MNILLMGRDEAGGSGDTHPLTRALVILGLIALGILYYVNLRGTSARGPRI